MPPGKTPIPSSAFLEPRRLAVLNPRFREVFGKPVVYAIPAFALVLTFYTLRILSVANPYGPNEGRWFVWSVSAITLMMALLISSCAIELVLKLTQLALWVLSGYVKIAFPTLLLMAASLVVVCVGAALMAAPVEYGVMAAVVLGSGIVGFAALVIAQWDMADRQLGSTIHQNPEDQWPPFWRQLFLTTPTLMRRTKHAVWENGSLVGGLLRRYLAVRGPSLFAKLALVAYLSGASWIHAVRSRASSGGGASGSLVYAYLILFAPGLILLLTGFIFMAVSLGRRERGVYAHTAQAISFTTIALWIVWSL